MHLLNVVLNESSYTVDTKVEQSLGENHHKGTCVMRRPTVVATRDGWMPNNIYKGNLVHNRLHYP
jgi:hypothetical protein